VKIGTIVRISQQGVSRPYVCLDESGTLYWCKGNHTGMKAVISEWICARIGRVLRLPVPECHIMRMDRTYFKRWCECNGGSCPQIVTETNQYVFASRHVEDAKDVICAESDLRNVDVRLLARIFLFDAFIRNTDRTACNSNLLINGGVHVIDHNNAFDWAFDQVAFMREHALSPLVSEIVRRESAAFECECREVVTEQFLDEVWSEMPGEWTDVGESVLSLERIKDFLLGGAKT